MWVFEGGPDEGGSYQSSLTAVLNNVELPAITVGYGIVNDPLPAMADRWVLLHELAHVSTRDILDEGHHGKLFCYAYIALVARFLGAHAAVSLIQECKNLKVRLDYRLFPVLDVC